MAIVPAEAHGSGDPALITAVQRGEVVVYRELYERHVAAAYNLARQLVRSGEQVDDLVSEAFAKVLEILRAGRGPSFAFRAYLLTVVRHTAYDMARRDRRIELVEDVGALDSVRLDDVTEPFTDTAVAGLERTLTARAFARLPERWQAVLWYTEVEGQSPGEAAPLLGLTPNGVSSLAYRAREGLRQAYLQVHLSDTVDEPCRAAAERLGSWTRGTLAKSDKRHVDVHLDSCDRCRALADELADVNGAMRCVIAPMVLGIGAVGYLAACGAGGVADAAGAAGALGAAGVLGAVSAVGAGGRRVLGVAATCGVLATTVFVLGLEAGSDGDTAPRAPVTTTTTATTTR